MEPKLYIIEGMDSTGKTTLARTLARKIAGVYIHASGNKALHAGMMAYHLNLLEIAKVNMENGWDVVMDRHWPSEYAYGTVLRPALSSSYDFSVIHGVLQMIGPTYVLCNSTEAFARHVESHQDRDHRYTEEQFYKIHHQYVRLFMDIPHHDYVLERDGLDTVGFCDKLI